MSKFRSLVGAFILFPLFVSCGKQDLLTNANREVKKGIVNGVNTLHKGFNDAVSTGSKAVSDSNETIKKGLTDSKRETDGFLTTSKNTIDRESSNGIYNGGKFIESVGQVPRKIANDILGTDEDSDENLHDLQKQVDAMYIEFYEALADLGSEMDEMKIELQGDNQALQDVVDNVHTSLLRQIRRGDRRSLSKIRALKNQLRDLRYNVRQIRRHINDLEVVCDYFRLGWRYFATYCELESNR